MTFILSKLFWFIFSPANFLVLLASIGALRLLVSRRRHGLGLALIGSFGLLAVTILPISIWALAPLEDRFPQRPLPERVDGIVVLGGSVNPRISQMRGQPTVPDFSERLFAASALARRYPSARIILSGGEATIVPRGFHEATVMRDVLAEEGIAANRIEIEGTSRNTYENAVETYRLAQPKPGETWLLVTSAWHMPRAMGCFRKAGWQIVPDPVGYRTARASDLMTTLLMPEETIRLNLAVKEWIGLVVYAALGRTDRLFPGP